MENKDESENTKKAKKVSKSESGDIMEKKDKSKNNKKNKKLCRSEKDCKIFGVCGGIAEYFNLDPTVVRVIWCICSLAWGFGLIAYLACALIMPKESEVK